MNWARKGLIFMGIPPGMMMLGPDGEGFLAASGKRQIEMRRPLKNKLYSSYNCLVLVTGSG